jgi:hypothetical protein
MTFFGRLQCWTGIIDPAELETLAVLARPNVYETVTFLWQARLVPA